MQQRVAIARALSLRPRLILADEPTGNLDTVTADEIFGLLREFNRDHGSACLIVTHDHPSGRFVRPGDPAGGRALGQRLSAAMESGIQQTRKNRISTRSGKRAPVPMNRLSVIQASAGCDTSNVGAQRK